MLSLFDNLNEQYISHQINYVVTLKKSIPEKNTSQNFRLKKIDETRNYLIEETDQNDLMSKKFMPL